jgi:hypothetical protein
MDRTAYAGRDALRMTRVFASRDDERHAAFYLREADVLGCVEGWIAELVSSVGIDTSIDRIARRADQLEDSAA